MKKILFTIFFIFVICLLVSCGNEQEVVLNKYTVEFHNYDGSLLYRTIVEEGSEAAYAGFEPTRPNENGTIYTFTGWDQKIDNVQEDMVVNAVYDSLKTNSKAYSLNIVYDNVFSSKALSAYHIDSKNTELELTNYGVKNENDYVLFYFELGSMSRVPVYSSNDFVYSGEKVINFSFNGLSEAGIDSKLDNIKNFIDESYSRQNFKIYDRSKEAASEEYTWNKSFGASVTNASRLKEYYVDNYNEGYEVKLYVSSEMSLTENKHYRLSLYEDIKCYAVLKYDIANRSFQVSYENIIQPADTKMVIEESNSSSYEYDTSKKFKFDITAAMKMARENMPFEEDTIYLTTTEEFINAMQGDTTGKYYMLDNETGIFDFGYEYVKFNVFQGTLDGNYCSFINWKAEEKSTGFMGMFTSNYGLIKNLTISNFSIYNNDPAIRGTLTAGLLCAENHQTIRNVTVSNCSMNLDVGDNSHSENSKIYAGTICGMNYGIIEGQNEIANCNVYAVAVTQYEGSESYVGGAVGYSQGGKIDGINAHNNTVKAAARADVKHGGLFGAENGHGRPYAYAGGIVGYSNNAQIGSNILVSSNSVNYELYRSCSHSTNKGGGSGAIKGN